MICHIEEDDPVGSEEDEFSDGSPEQDVSLTPGPTADPQGDVENFIPNSINSKYTVYSYRHAASILATSFPDEFRDILQALENFRITQRDIGMPGGNESDLRLKNVANQAVSPS